MKQSHLPVVPIPETLKTRFIRAANKQGRSMSDVIRLLIIEYVEEQEAKAKAR
jgi:metal-responsive CopG/Arc/MetJ family transcriptional regulator